MRLKAIINGQVLDHGLLGKIANSNTTSNATHMEPKAKAEFEKQVKEDMKMVKARFVLGNKAEVYNDIAHIPAPCEPIHRYRFIDGYIYEIPKGLVDKVNKEGVHIKRGQRVMANGSMQDNDVREVIREFVPAGW